MNAHIYVCDIYIVFRNMNLCKINHLVKTTNTILWYINLQPADSPDNTMQATHSKIMCLHNPCSQNLTLHTVCKIRTNKMHGKILPYLSLSCGQQLTLKHPSIHIHTVQYSYIQYAFSTSYVNFKNSTEKLYIYITYGQENEILTTMTKYYELWLVKLPRDWWIF